MYVPFVDSNAESERLGGSGGAHGWRVDDLKRREALTGKLPERMPRKRRGAWFAVVLLALGSEVCDVGGWD